MLYKISVVILSLLSFLFIQSCSYSSEKNPLLIKKKTPPSPIRILSTVHGADSISIEWSPPAENDFSYVFITWMPGGAAGVRVNSGTNSYAITGLSSAVDYTIELTSVDTDGYKSSPVDVFKSRDTIRPGTITISGRSETNDYTGITFNWNPPADTDLNHVEVSWLDAGGTTESRSVPEGTNFISITGLSKLIDYTFLFTSVDDAGNRSLTPATEIKYRDTTAPPSVTDVNLADYYTSISLNWTNPSVADFHHIRITWNSESTVLASGENSFTINGTSSNTDYNINIYSVDDAGNESDPPYNIQKTRDVTIPGTVTDISYDSTKLHKVSINWKDPADADLKHILVTWTDENGNLAGSQIIAKSANSGRANSFYKDNLDSSKTYRFIVTAVDYAGNTADSSPVIKYKDTTPPGRIRNESQENHLHEITITWEDPEEPVDPDEMDFSRVKISWLSGSTLIGTDYVNKGVKTFTKTGLDSSKDYSFRLYGVDEDGNESLPVEVFKSKDVTAPGTVTDVLAVTPADGSGISITWADPAEPPDSRDRDFDHIKIAWADESGTITGSAVKPEGACAFSMSGLDGSKRYTFKLISVDEDGNESAAVIVTKYRETVPPGQVTITGLTEGNTTVSFTWNDPADTDFDHVEITWSPGGTTINSVGKGTQGYSVTGLVNKTEYTISITSVDTAGNSSAPYIIKAIPALSEKVNFLIYTADDLNAVRGGSSDPRYSGWDKTKSYIMMADIDLSGFASWIPIGTSTVWPATEAMAPASGDPFTGNLNGNGHTITGLNINRPGLDYNGLFGYVGGGSIIRNLKIENCSVTGGRGVGGLIGMFYTTSSDARVMNCYVSGTITGAGSNGIGGLAGWLKGGTSGSILTRCGTKVTININNGGSYIGGLIGNSNSGWAISESFADGTIFSTPNVNFVGGFIGFSNVAISNCYSRVNVSVLGWFVGGFAGRSNNSASFCYETGDIIRNSGTGTYYGGFVYDSLSSAVFTNSYYCGALPAGISDNAYAVRKTPAEMKIWAAYSGWNSTLWAIDSLINEGYPFLKNNPPK